MAKKMNTMILGFVLMITTFTVLCSATIYTVGDSDGWTAKEDFYYSWVDPKRFYVGDSLVFDYDPNFNDVTQISGVFEYQFCDFSSPEAVYKTGHDVVTLTEPGSYYFISSNHSQCSSGQRLDVLVNHPRPIPPPPLKVNDYLETSGDLESKFCDPAVYKTGHDLVKPTEPGVNYFLCSQSWSHQLYLASVPNPKSSPIDRFMRWLITKHLHRFSA